MAIALHASEPDATPQNEYPVKPLRGLVYTARDIEEVRKQVREHGANGELVTEILNEARRWTERSDAEVSALIPPAGSVFAYGTAGDPKTDQAWPRFGRDGAMCQWDRPGTVRSPHTGDIYGAANPGEPYYDPGTGWKRESDGQVFYFKGIWNAWVVDQLHNAVDNLAIAYMLTGEPAQARRALVILDRLATLRVQLPMTGNSVADWPHTATRAEAKGFFHYMGNIANQRAINTAFAFDLLANAPYGSEPSAEEPSLTVRDNIAKNYFEIYERRYFDVLRSLTNHGIVLMANLITQGVLFGDAEKLREGLAGMQGFFDNTINRDGDYMEVSGSYGRLGRDYGSRLLMPLSNYMPENYPDAVAMPKVADFTGGLKPNDDPRWFNTAVRTLYRLPLVGRYPQYGDMGADRNILVDTDGEWLAKHRALFLRILYHNTSREDWKREIEALYPRAAAQKKAATTLEDLLLYGPALWIEPKGGEGTLAGVEEKSDLMAGKAIAILRGGKGASARALFLRGGINSWHGHDDQMTLVPYGHGMSLFGEYGYRWAGTPDNLGWGTRSIGHNALVVDEDLPAPYLYKGFSKSISAPAASVTAFLPDAPAQLVEMRNPKLWKRAKLQDYRRAAWLVDIDADRYYFVDIFHVVGGNTHDYAWTAPYIAPGIKESFQIEGVKPTAREGVWTLASVGGKYRGEPWNQRGQSWGERLNGENGMVAALPGGERLPTSKWNPEPGNGYGMIWNVALADTKEDWRAIWPLPDRKHSLRMHLVNFEGMTAITALSPTMSSENHFNMIVARRSREKESQLQSRFVNVAEVGQPGTWPLAKVDRITLQASGEASDAVGIRCTLSDGSADYLFASRTSQSLAASEGLGINGRNGFVRLSKEGRLIAAAMQEGSSLQAAGLKIEAVSAAFQAPVLAVQSSGDESRLVIGGSLPPGDRLAGATAWVDSSVGGVMGYHHNDYLRIEQVEVPTPETSVLVFRNQSLVAATLQIEEVDREKSQAQLFWNHTLAGNAGALSYQGRAVVPSGDGASAENPPGLFIREIVQRTVSLNDSKGLKSGQRVDVLVTKPGDTFTMPTTVTLIAMSDKPNAWKLRTNVPVRITIPTSAGPRIKEFPAGESVVEL